jgi:hypothetical protein
VVLTPAIRIVVGICQHLSINGSHRARQSFWKQGFHAIEIIDEGNQQASHFFRIQLGKNHSQAGIRYPTGDESAHPWTVDFGHTLDIPERGPVGQKANSGGHDRVLELDLNMACAPWVGDFVGGMQKGLHFSIEEA